MIVDGLYLLYLFNYLFLIWFWLILCDSLIMHNWFPQKHVTSWSLENSPKKRRALIGQKSCCYLTIRLWARDFYRVVSIT